MNTQDKIFNAGIIPVIKIMDEGFRSVSNPRPDFLLLQLCSPYYTPVENLVEAVIRWRAVCMG